MSKEQIERILKSDFSYIDHSIDAKINNIEQISGKLSERSNFLSQFQMMLQKELGKIKSAPQKALSEQVIVKCEPAIQEVQVEMEQKDMNEDNIVASQISYENNQLQETTEQAISHHSVSPQKAKQQQRYQIKQILLQLQAVQMQIDEYKLLNNFLKQEIRGQIEYFKTIIIKSIQQSFRDAIVSWSQKYQQQIKQLKCQSTQLKASNQKYLVINNPLSDLTFFKLNEQNSLNMTQRLKQYEMPKPKMQTPVPKNITSNTVINSQEWKTYRLNFNEDAPLSKGKTKQKQLKNQLENYVLPSIKTLTVGIPPIKNGFGVLKSGNEVIYKGMWRDGKFDGSGRLAWDEYCYEGNFAKGCFEGHGRLQIKDMVYAGKFQANKAYGEGTMEVNNKKIMGVWENNTLIRMF